MKRIITLLTGLLSLLGIHAPAQNKVADRSLLWQISGKQLSKPSYLFGTIHLICPQDYVWTPPMTKALNNSDKLCLEMDMDDQSVIMEAAMGMMDHSGKKLKDHFTPQQYTQLSAYVKDSLGMDISMLEGMKPIALQTMIGTRSVLCDDPVSYEDSIMKAAQAKHKEVLGLEEAKEQLAVLESMPTDSVIKEVMDVVQGKDNNDRMEYVQMINAYKQQDLAALYTLITGSGEFGSDLAVFLDDRNKRWIPRMSAKMKGSSVFFAVGAGHLWGVNGVINLLRQDGYKVEPLR